MSSFLLGLRVSVIALAGMLCLHGEARNVEVVHIGMVHPTILAIEIEVGAIERGEIIPYEFDPASDEIDDHPPTESGDRWVRRSGTTIGAVLGPEKNWLRTFDTFIEPEENLRLSRLDDASEYSIAPRVIFAGSTPITAVHRKSTPIGMAMVAPWQWRFPFRHTIYLQLESPIESSSPWRLELPLPAPSDVTGFIPDLRELRSEAIHVNQIGFRPDELSKKAYLSCWMGDGGGVEYPNGISFELIDASGETVYQGRTSLRKMPDQPEDNRGLYTYADGEFNHSKAPVFEMDFSDFDQPGEYRVFAEGIGVSYPFEIRETVWDDLFSVSMQGLLVHRSGIELGPPHTPFERPRSFHPDDGVTIYETSARWMNSPSFDEIIAGKTETTIDAWGGYMDAGDWDRRIQHLSVTYNLLDLIELFPEHYSSLRLSLPENTNDLPDIIDEALYNLDCYRRMQLSEGSIRGGIESAEHPRFGEPSWLESLEVYAFAHDPKAGFIYAAVAAKAAAVLRRHDPDLALVYEESAERAWQSSSLEVSQSNNEEVLDAVRDDSNWASIELFRLTEKPLYHERFLETTDLDLAQPNQTLFDQHEAIYTYAITEHELIGRRLQNHARTRLVASLKKHWIDEAVEASAFQWAKNPWAPHGWSNGTAPQSENLLRAFVLTQDEELLRAAVLSTGIGLGANPNNRVHTTGVGDNPVRNPLHLDSVYSGQPSPVGITVYGSNQHPAHEWVATSAMTRPEESIYPDYYTWPLMENFHDVYLWPAQTEYTVHQTFGRVSYVWGFLAALDGNTAPPIPAMPSVESDACIWPLHDHDGEKNG